MIKKTLYFGNPCFINCKDLQLIINKKSETGNSEETKIPIEDIGVVIVDHFGVALTQYSLSLLLENNVAVVICNSSHLPAGMLLNLDGNALQSEFFKNQVNASVPLKKQLWQQTISYKISNQASLLKSIGKNSQNIFAWSEQVKSGDTSNLEARASAYYWKNLFSPEINFSRDRYGEPPNNLLNYGYAVLRAVVARSLVGSGLLPTLGIHHHNKYNAYCLADDIMEPYRPFVDKIVLEITKEEKDISELNTNIKKKLLIIPTLDVYLDDERKPLMVAMHKTTASLAKCYSGEIKKIKYPEFSK
ncbi:MAG: type II CRISPR-associated endonuclease Cas1 [Ignavibacteriae bacterium]|nr:type II CRISPR-associated endonuclease Cas1 [Ignavibacteriota bacterium]